MLSEEGMRGVAEEEAGDMIVGVAEVEGPEEVVEETEDH